MDREASTSSTPSNAAPPLSKEQLEHFRRRLIDEMMELYWRVRRDLRRDVEDQPPVDPGDEPDESIRTDLRDLTTIMDEREAALARAMEEALDRIDREDYGICVDCQRPIEIERLEVLPWAIRCAADQEAFEKQRQMRPPTL